MLNITIPALELYDAKKEEFINFKEQHLQLEHSLVSLSKWESKWCKPFLSKDKKTSEESTDYIRCMTITQNVNDEMYKHIPSNIIDEIGRYIESPMTATTFIKDNQPTNRETITAEVIYYQMIALNIPFECQKWHLNKLLTLINVCAIKTNPPKKLSKREIMSRNAALNEQRRRELNSKG